jgi:hypothetical protein
MLSIIKYDIMASRELPNQNIKMSSNIKASLMKGLYRARKNIERNKDIYMDSEHELLCEYYKKYTDLSKQFESEKIKISYNTFKIDKHILSESHEKADEVIFKDFKIKFEAFRNKYNKKFINELYVSTNPEDYEKWIQEQNEFIRSLSPEEIYTLRCHTHDGDIITNYFIRNNFVIDKHIDDVGYEIQRKSTLIVEKAQFKSNRDYILFYYQIKEYLYKKNAELSKSSRIELEEYIKAEYNTFDWGKILLLYIRDINNIFEKCPSVKKTLVIYRGSNDDYYLKNSTYGVHITKTLSSHTLNPKVAIGYADIKCCIMRVKLSAGCKAILIDNISGYEEEDEILLPFNTKYYIDYARHSINYYKNNLICPDETMAKKITVTDLTVIPPRMHRLSRPSPKKSSQPASPSQYYSAKSKSSVSSKYYSAKSS